MENILVIEELSKSFGDKKILDKLSMEVPTGSVYGFLGRNGAGKTTTMKLILGLLESDDGEIEVLGRKIKFGKSGINKDIGFLPDVPEYYEYMSGKEYLTLCANLLNIEKSEIKTRVIEIIKKVGLDYDNKKIGGYSRGMKQRLGIAQALIGKPKLLICDEPTSALDPIGRRDILAILSSLSDETTVIFSTHIISDIEHICDHVGILSDGKIIVSGNLAKLKEEHLYKKIIIEFRSEEDTEVFKKALVKKDKNNITAATKNQIVYRTSISDEDSKDLFKILIDKNIVPKLFSVESLDLEEMFMEGVK